eukprot:m.58174 g.58174  ORF g.58174 m.58174 type:complete len:1029 (-) comp11158_c1_seq3:271-3357(-)
MIDKKGGAMGCKKWLHHVKLVWNIGNPSRLQEWRCFGVEPDSEKLKRILPNPLPATFEPKDTTGNVFSHGPPDDVLYFFNDASELERSVLLHRGYRATIWLLAALRVSHSHVSIRHWIHALLASSYTGVMHRDDAQFLEMFGFLQDEIHSYNTLLTDKLDQECGRLDLRTKLSITEMDKLVTRPVDYGDLFPNDSVSHRHLIPLDPDIWDVLETKYIAGVGLTQVAKGNHDVLVWRMAERECCHLHLLIMIATLVNQRFQNKVQNLIRQNKLSFKPGNVKTYSQAYKKLLREYRNKGRYRGVYVTDLIRCEISPNDVTELKDFVVACNTTFGGIVRIQTPFVGDENKVLKEGHINLTIMFETGVTYGDLISSEESMKLLNEYCTIVPRGENPERWLRQTTYAKEFLMSPFLVDVSVRTLGEVQLLLPILSDIQRQQEESRNILSALNPSHLKPTVTMPKSQHELSSKFVEDSIVAGSLQNIQFAIDHGMQVNDKYHPDATCSCLHLAVQHGHLDIVHYLLEMKANVNIGSYIANKESPLELAVSKGCYEICQTLLIYNASSPGRWHPAIFKEGLSDICSLYYAIHDRKDLKIPESTMNTCAQLGHAGLIKTLVINNADVSSNPDTGISPLQTAIIYKQSEAARSLITLGAPLVSQTAKCETFGSVTCLLDDSPTICMAVQQGLFTVVKEILSRNGHCIQTLNLLGQQERTLLCTKEKQTPLIVACNQGDPSMVELLLSDSLIQKHIDVKDVDDCTALSYCLMRSYGQAARILLRSGANAVTSGISPFTGMCVSGNFAGCLALLQGDIDIDELFELSYDNRKTSATSLVVCSSLGLLDAVVFLLKQKADPNIFASRNRGQVDSPLIVAASHGHVNICEQLVLHGADVDEVGTRGVTALITAVQNSHLEVVQCLLFAGADTCCVTDSDWFLIDSSIKCKDIRILESLVSKCDIRNNHHLKPLHVAVQQVNPKALALLLQIIDSRDLHAKDEKGRTPLQLAQEKLTNDNSCSSEQERKLIAIKSLLESYTV